MAVSMVGRAKLSSAEAWAFDQNAGGAGKGMFDAALHGRASWPFGKQCSGGLRADVAGDEEEEEEVEFEDDDEEDEFEDDDEFDDDEADDDLEELDEDAPEEEEEEF